MGSVLSTCMSAVRHLPLWSAVDIPWSLLEEKEMAKASVIYPEIDFKNEDKITQTAARFLFVFILPSIAKPIGFVSLGLGTTHLIWCIVNIKKISANEDGYSRQEIEKALIRICSGVYDLGIAYLLGSSLMNSFIGKLTIPVIFAFLPTYPIQLHHLIFEKASKAVVPPPSDDKAEKKAETPVKKPEIDHHVLSEDCLIRQFCEGLTVMFVPKIEAPDESRLMALPNAMGTWGRNQYKKYMGSKPTEPPK